MPDSRADPTELLASLARRKLSLDVQTLDLCFLAALHLRAEQGLLAAFSEEQLIEVFEQVCRIVEPGAESRRRASDAIRRLREQRLLARVDGATVVRAGEFALTRLSTSILEYFLEQETLTREDLTALMCSLLSCIVDLLAASQSARTAEEWGRLVLTPLRVTVRDLVNGIQRRQRGFDTQQEELQREMAALLSADWFGALDRCQGLLESTSLTLRELNQVLLRDAHEIQRVLQDLHESAASAGMREAEETTHQVIEQMDRVAAWGSARQRAWSEYYQYVHRFLRDVVRFDPTRIITHRLRERLAGGGGPAVALTVAAAPPIQLLRRVEPPTGERLPVRRRRSPDDSALDERLAEDPVAKLESGVRAAIRDGARSLRDVTQGILDGVPREEHFATVGRIAQAVARVSKPEGAAERPWMKVQPELAIEEWTVPESS